MITLVLGSQWGDEGKGKLVDILCPNMDLCCRAQGGNNAGHTIVADGLSYDFHILPSGLINRQCKNLIGSGCVVHIPSFFKELQDLEQKGLDSTSRIFISDRAQVVFDLHLLIDGLEERDLKEAAKDGHGNSKGRGEIGTTGKGIGPTYSTKTARSGVPINQIFDKEEMDQRLRKLATATTRRYGDLGSYDVEAEIRKFDDHRERLLPFVVDAVEMMNAAQQNEQQRILVEGANALMLDVDHGTYPFVTSSSTGTGGAVAGLGLDVGKVREIIGVVKAYTTRVGSGPFPTELKDQAGENLRHLGREYGVTTGRPRRCGWLDLVMLRYSQAVNHYTALNLTKLDVLDTFDTIKVAVAYKLDGRILHSFPANLKKLERCEVVYEELKGWAVSTTGHKKYDDLPDLAKAYVEYVEKAIGVSITTIGTGPDRESMIYR